MTTRPIILTVLLLVLIVLVSLVPQYFDRQQAVDAVNCSPYYQKEKGVIYTSYPTLQPPDTILVRSITRSEAVSAESSFQVIQTGKISPEIMQEGWVLEFANDTQLRSISSPLDKQFVYFSVDGAAEFRIEAKNGDHLTRFHSIPFGEEVLMKSLNDLILVDGVLKIGIPTHRPCVGAENKTH